MIRQLLYPSKFEPINAPANPVAPTQWFAPLSEPRKIVTAAAVLIASGCTLPPQPPVVAATVPQGWYSPLSVPVTAVKRFQPEYRLPAQPPQPDYVPAHGWFVPFSQPVKAAKQYQPEYRLPAQPPTVAATIPQGWYSQLSQPQFRPQADLTRNALVSSYIFSFKTPAAAVAPPILSFFRPLSQPIFAQVKHPFNAVPISKLVFRINRKSADLDACCSGAHRPGRRQLTPPTSGRRKSLASQLGILNDHTQSRHDPRPL
jgi:hypothetical protein